MHPILKGIVFIHIGLIVRYLGNQLTLGDDVEYSSTISFTSFIGPIIQCLGKDCFIRKKKNALKLLCQKLGSIGCQQVKNCLNGFYGSTISGQPILELEACYENAIWTDQMMASHRLNQAIMKPICLAVLTVIQLGIIYYIYTLCVYKRETTQLIQSGDSILNSLNLVDTVNSAPSQSFEVVEQIPNKAISDTLKKQLEEKESLYDIFDGPFVGDIINNDNANDKLAEVKEYTFGESLASSKDIWLKRKTVTDSIFPKTITGHDENLGPGRYKHYFVPDKVTTDEIKESFKNKILSKRQTNVSETNQS